MIACAFSSACSLESFHPLWSTAVGRRNALRRALELFRSAMSSVQGRRCPPRRLQIRPREAKSIPLSTMYQTRPIQANAR